MLENITTILFDFDGLLVKTEQLHYDAYKRSLQEFGYPCSWDLTQYCLIAHSDANALRRTIEKQYPEFLQNKNLWDEMYELKKQYLLKHFAQNNVPLMPGVAAFLNLVLEQGKQCCVVTHSPSSIVDPIKEQHPILKEISLWLTRSDYEHSKPHPDGYLKALHLLNATPQESIGFEDTPRGVRALLRAGVSPIMVTEIPYPDIIDLEAQGVSVVNSFNPNDALVINIDKCQSLPR